MVVVVVVVVVAGLVVVVAAPEYSLIKPLDKNNTRTAKLPNWSKKCLVCFG